jgi:hypothetical protein
MLANLANLAHSAHGALVLGVVLGAVKGTLLERCTAVDGGVAGRAHIKLSELIKLDLNSIMRVALALSLSSPGLFRVLATGTD